MAKSKTEINPIRAERLKELLLAENLSQEEFASRIGKGQQSISRYITKRGPITESIAERIVKAFPNVSFSWLMGFDDEIYKKDAKLNDDEAIFGVFYYAKMRLGYNGTFDRTAYNQMKQKLEDNVEFYVRKYLLKEFG